MPNNVSCAPIALFVYDRLAHTRLTIEALQNNLLSEQSTLYVFSDGGRTEGDETRIKQVRECLRSIKGFQKVHIIERESNYGLAESIIQGVTEMLKAHEHVIVVEDDLVTSPFFLTFMNDGLHIYGASENVASIHGYIYPIRAKLPETFFLRGADCWGWATWKRAWDVFEPDGRKLLQELRSRRLEYSFDFSGSYPYIKMLEDRIAGNNQSWAILWHASTFIKEMYTLYPGKSLVQNIGGDNSGVHMGRSNKFDVELAWAPIVVSHIEVKEHPDAVQEVASFLRSLKPSVARRIASGVKKMILQSRHR